MDKVVVVVFAVLALVLACLGVVHNARRAKYEAFDNNTDYIGKTLRVWDKSTAAGLNVQSGGSLCVGGTCMDEQSLRNVNALVNGSGAHGRYIKLQMQQPGCMNLESMNVYSMPGGPDIALNKPVTKSSGWGNDAYPGANLTDGNINTLMHSSCQDAAWAICDLGSVQPISQITIVNRTDCCQSRIHGTIVSILDGNQNTVYTSLPLTGTLGETGYEQGDSYRQYVLYPPDAIPVGVNPY